MVALRVFAGGKRLTARQAKWVADLRPLMGTLSAGDDGAVQDAYALAVTYAARGRAAAALAKATGLVEPPIPLGHESDTWALDVTLAATSTENHLITWNTFEAITEAGLVNEPIWEEGGLRGSVRTEVPSIIPLYELLREASLVRSITRLAFEGTPHGYSDLRLITYENGAQGESKLLANCEAHGRWIDWKAE